VATPEFEQLRRWPCGEDRAFPARQVRGTLAAVALDLVAELERLDDRIDVAWRGHTVPMVSRAGLIAMKRVSNRPQDLVDIALLERGPDAP
jgi:hypothetical protein